MYASKPAADSVAVWSERLSFLRMFNSSMDKGSPNFPQGILAIVAGYLELCLLSIREDQGTIVLELRNVSAPDRVIAEHRLSGNFTENRLEISSVDNETLRHGQYYLVGNALVEQVAREHCKNGRMYAPCMLYDFVKKRYVNLRHSMMQGIFVSESTCVGYTGVSGNEDLLNQRIFRVVETDDSSALMACENLSYGFDGGKSTPLVYHAVFPKNVLVIVGERGGIWTLKTNRYRARLRKIRDGDRDENVFFIHPLPEYRLVVGLARSIKVFDLYDPLCRRPDSEPKFLWEYQTEGLMKGVEPMLGAQLAVFSQNLYDKTNSMDIRILNYSNGGYCFLEGFTVFSKCNMAQVVDGHIMWKSGVKDDASRLVLSEGGASRFAPPWVDPELFGLMNNQKSQSEDGKLAQWFANVATPYSNEIRNITNFTLLKERLADLDASSIPPRNNLGQWVRLSGELNYSKQIAGLTDGINVHIGSLNAKLIESLNQKKERIDELARNIEELRENLAFERNFSTRVSNELEQARTERNLAVPEKDVNAKNLRRLGGVLSQQRDEINAMRARQKRWMLGVGGGLALAGTLFCAFRMCQRSSYKMVQ